MHSKHDIAASTYVVMENLQGLPLSRKFKLTWKLK